jgi:hypothetical protein
VSSVGAEGEYWESADTAEPTRCWRLGGGSLPLPLLLDLLGVALELLAFPFIKPEPASDSLIRLAASLSNPPTIVLNRYQSAEAPDKRGAKECSRAGMDAK